MPLLVSITHHSFCLLLADNLSNVLLTDYVLLGIVAQDDITRQLKTQLAEQVKPHYDLKQCGQILERLADQWKNQEKRFEMVLSGFYTNGRAGELTCRSGQEKINELVYPFRGTHEYLYTFIPPDPSLLDAAEFLLELPDEDPTTLNHYAEHLASMVYPVTSVLYPGQVHSLGQLLALEKRRPPRSTPIFHQKNLDISRLIHTLPPR